MPLSVARECRATPLGDVSAPSRSPRVPPGTLGRRLCPIPLPVSAARHLWATFPAIIVARGDGCVGVPADGLGLRSFCTEKQGLGTGGGNYAVSGLGTRTRSL